MGLDAARGCELVPWTTTAPPRTHTIRHGHRPTQTFLHPRATLFYFYFVSMKTTHPTTSSRNNSNSSVCHPSNTTTTTPDDTPTFVTSVLQGTTLTNAAPHQSYFHHTTPHRPRHHLYLADPPQNSAKSDSNDWTAGTLATPFPCTPTQPQPVRRDPRWTAPPQTATRGHSSTPRHPLPLWYVLATFCWQRRRAGPAHTLDVAAPPVVCVDLPPPTTTS